MQKVYDLSSLVAGLKNKTLTFSADKPVHACFKSNMELLDRELDNPNHEGLIPIKAKAYHDGMNLNGSKIEFETFMDKTPTMSLRPILANVVTDEQGVKDFGAHDRAYSFDEEGNIVETILEQPIGCIASFSFEEDEMQDVMRAIAHGYLWQDYAKDAIDIMNKRGEVNCSVELSIKAMRIEQDTLILDDYFVMGLTLLGKDFEPGMAGSTASVKNFVTDSQKKDEDDQELQDTVEEEEEALKKQEEEEERQRQEEEERQRQEEEERQRQEEERRQSSDSVSAQGGPSVIKNSPKSSKPVAKAEPKEEPKPEEKAAAPTEKEESKETKEEPKEEAKEVENMNDDKSLNALVLESLNMVLTTDAKGEFIYISAYSGNPESPIEGETKQVALLDMETMTRFANENKELLTFKAEKERAEKEAIINDPLYESLRNGESFKDIIDNIDKYSKEEVDHKCLAAFAQSKKEESIKSPYSLKNFAAHGMQSVKDSYKEERYGSIFSDRNEKHNK